MSEKIRVVMIDDEEPLCVVVKANLEDTGEFDVVYITDPKEAETTVEKENPDIIILDNIMPGRNGVDIIKDFKSKGGDLASVPIIMVSGKGEMVYNDKKDEFKWMPNNPAAQGAGNFPDGKSAEALSEAYGVDDYISKPFTTDLMVEVIKSVLQRKRKTKTDEE